MNGMLRSMLALGLPALLLGLCVASAQPAADGYGAENAWSTGEETPSDYGRAPAAEPPSWAPDRPERPEPIEDPLSRLEQVPSVKDLPEQEAFEPVRELLAQRSYDEALAALDKMKQDPGARLYWSMIARDKRYAIAAKAVVQAGYEGLKKQVGQRHRLLFASGIAMDVTILEVGEDYMVVDLAGEGRTQRMPLSRLHVDRVIRHAAHAYAPDNPANQTIFAVMYAMEGCFPDAYKMLTRAAAAGYDVTEARGYVDGERLWAAAVEKQMIERQAGLGLIGGGKTAKAVVDCYRGSPPDQELRAVLQEAGLELTQVRGPLSRSDLEGAAVLLTIDPGYRTSVPAYTPADVGLIGSFVASGGGLMMMGAQRVRYYKGRLQASPSPYNSMLGQFMLELKAERLVLAAEARARPGPPRVLAGAAPGHPVTSGVGQVAFERDICLVNARMAGWLLVAEPAAASALGVQPPLVLGAASTAGMGRVVALGGVPDLDFKDARGTQAGRLLITNAVRWLAYPKMRAAAARSTAP